MLTLCDTEIIEMIIEIMEYRLDKIGKYWEDEIERLNLVSHNKDFDYKLVELIQKEIEEERAARDKNILSKSAVGYYDLYKQWEDSEP